MSRECNSFHVLFLYFSRVIMHLHLTVHKRIQKYFFTRYKNREPHSHILYNANFNSSIAASSVGSLVPNSP